MNSSVFRLDNVYFAISEQASIAVFTAVFSWLVKHVRLHWNSWRWNYSDLYEFYRNTELPEEKK